MRNRPYLKRFLLYATLALVLLTSVVGCQLIDDTDLTTDGQLTVHFIDVGQGDAILIQFPSGQNMLIDAGGRQAADTVISYLRQQGVQTIDHCIGTHPHEDHIGGLAAVIDTFAIGQVYLPRVEHTTRAFERLVKSIKDKNLKVQAARAGLQIDVGPEAQAVMLAPVAPPYEELNNYSAVVRVVYGRTAALFTGDAESRAEYEMLHSGTELGSELLKVSHHGGRSSNSSDFLTQVQPQHAVISVGTDNSYGHPHAEVLSRLWQLNTSIYRTDVLGTIVFTSDGEQFTTRQQAAPHLEISMTVDRKAEIVTLQNDGQQTIDLEGWRLISEVGQQRFTFPAGVRLKPGAAMQIVAGPNARSGPNKLIWTKNYIWNNDFDPATLYDNAGHLVTYCDR